jgi:hypothetical protein
MFNRSSNKWRGGLIKLLWLKVSVLLSLTHIIFVLFELSPASKDGQLLYVGSQTRTEPPQVQSNCSSVTGREAYRGYLGLSGLREVNG